MGLRIRQYKPCDAEHIVSWIKDEEALRKWSSDRFGEFPITSEDINNKYLDNNVLFVTLFDADLFKLINVINRHLCQFCHNN